MSIEQDITTMEQQPVSYFTRQVDAFYQHLYKSLSEYLSDTPPTKKDEEPYRNFLEYWTYTLFRDYGIKRKIHKYGETQEKEFINDLDRRIYGDNKKLLVQFYYDKGNRAYDKTAMITQLCRHMLFDMSSFAIVSLGVPKALSDLGELWNAIPDVNGNDEKNIVVEEQREGTMLIYNPSLEQFNYEIVQRDVDEEVEQSERQIRHFETSTRRKIGTSYFNNPGKTFKEMFDENNVAAGLDWDKIPDKIKNKYCFVFNVEHTENRIVSPFITSGNTLVGVYKLPDVKQCREFLFNLINKNELLDDRIFFLIYNNANSASICEYSPHTINMELLQYEQQFKVPGTLAVFNNVSLSKLTMDCDNFVKTSLRKYDIGISVRDAFSGVRTKVRNPVYTELLELKGHHPMSLNENNNASLFRLWWRLKNDKQIKKFLGVFETVDGEYEKLFRSYHNQVVALTQNLFDVYQSVFVRKNMPAKDIEYKFKPMCGDLHKAYMVEKRGRIKKDVIEYVNTREWYQIYWRIFGLSEDIETVHLDNDGETTDKVNLPDTE